MENDRSNPWGAITPGRVVSYLAHIALDPWVAIVCLVVFSVGVSLSIGLAITVVGGAIALAITLAAAQGIGQFERARAAALLGVTVRPPIRQMPQIGDQPVRFGIIGRLIHDRNGWRALSYLFVQPIVGTLTFAVTFATWCLGPLLISFPLTRNIFPSDSANLWFADIDTTRKALLAAAIGVGVLIASPLVTIAAGLLDLAVIKALLGGSDTDELRAQVVEVSARRNAAVDAADAERRRIERDLHDGAQQRLVALGMTLGLAKENFDKDPQSVRLLLEEAHSEAKSAMTELRAIARGIHPAVLDDRGLDAALSAVAARCPIPVSVNVDLPNRLPQSLESTAYYVVSEALTNIAKHADARQASVAINVQIGGTNSAQSTPPAELMVIVVADDGKGGARFTPDGGLSGLQDRVRAVNGNLSMYSPHGGPTVMTAEIPT